MKVSDLRLQSGYWYLATPYSKWSDGIDDAAFVAAKLRGRLVVAGVAAFSPIVHSHYVARAANIDPFSHEIWMPDDKPMFEGSVGLLIADLSGWRESKGVSIEREWATARGMPTVLLDPVTLDWETMP